MSPEKKPSPSPLGYIPVETTDADSTTTKSTSEFPITAITIEAQPTSIPTQQPPQPNLSKAEVVLRGIVSFLLLAGAIVVISHVMNAMDEYPLKRYGPEIHVHAVSLSLKNLSTSRIITEGEITFHVTRARDCSISRYDDFEVAIFYEEKPLTMTIMEPFTQIEMNNTMVKAMFPSIISPIETRVSKRIASYFTSNSSFELSFDVKAKGNMWPNDWMGSGDIGSQRLITFRCPNVKVEIVAKTGLGTMAGEALKCEVKGKSAIYDGI